MAPTIRLSTRGSLAALRPAMGDLWFWGWFKPLEVPLECGMYKKGRAARLIRGCSIEQKELESLVKNEDGRLRVAIEGVSPEIDEGRFPAKRCVGDDVTVRADIFADGH